MTANHKAPEPPGPHPYFMAIEDVFLDLRGSPLQLSNADWQLAEKWFTEGVPLALVERTVRATFARREAEKDRKKKKKVWSLRYCKRSVEAAWRRQQELAAPGVAAELEDELDLAGRLERLAAALPVDLVARDEVARRISTLSGDAESIESALAKIDHEVVDDARRRLSASERSEVGRELAATRSALAQRLPAAELERSALRLEEEILRRRSGLPVLSLFAPEATGDGEPE